MLLTYQLQIFWRLPFVPGVSQQCLMLQVGFHKMPQLHCMYIWSVYFIAYRQHHTGIQSSFVSLPVLYMSHTYLYYVARCSTVAVGPHDAQCGCQAFGWQTIWVTCFRPLGNSRDTPFGRRVSAWQFKKILTFLFFEWISQKVNQFLLHDSILVQYMLLFWQLPIIEHRTNKHGALS